MLSTAEDARRDPFGSWYQDITSQIPACTRICVFVFVTLNVLFAIFSDFDIDSLALDVKRTILQGQIYRFFLSFLIQDSFISFIVACSILFSVGSRTERRIGSVRFGLRLAFSALILNASFLLVMTALAYNPLYPIPSMTTLISRGIWATLMTLIVLDCKETPEESRRVFVWSFDSSTYPCFVAVLFVFLSRRFAVDVVLGYALGELLHRGIFVVPFSGDSNVQLWEASYGRTPGFVDAAGVQSTIVEASASVLPQTSNGGRRSHIATLSDTSPLPSSSVRSNTFQSATRGPNLSSFTASPNDTSITGLSAFPGKGNVLGTGT